MELTMGLIFKMKRVELGNEIYNVYKCIDADFGITGYSERIEGFIPFHYLTGKKFLPLISEDNKMILNSKFNEEGYYSGLPGNDKFYELCAKENFDLVKVKQRLCDFWGGYLILKQGKTLAVIQKPENVKKLDKIFGQNSSLAKNRLIEFGEFLTDKEYLSNPAIGRDEEIEDLEIALITPDKSGILVGDAGVGKTAIVEGLAYKIKNGLVPDKLKNTEIISISSSSLISGCKYVGMVEERVGKVINELKNNKNIIMFIDEVHTIIGTGAGEKSNLDVANILKPFLDRGDIKIIGATTTEEYANLMNDPAFKRRFKKISVFEPERNLLLGIIKETVKSLEKYYKINFISKNNDFVFNSLLDLTNQKSRDHFDIVKNPDLVLSIVKESFAIALLYNHKEVMIEDIIKAIKKCDRIYKTAREKYSLKLINYFSDKDEELTECDKKNCKILQLPNSYFNNI